MSTLQYLYLQDNNITILDKSAFGKLPVLFELDLHKNRITDIRKRAFDGLLQLLTLNLSSNELVNIPNEAFFGLPSLRNLDLKRNHLTKLDNKTNGVLDDLLSLERLDLSFNKISFVTKKTFPSNQYVPYNLKYLDLSFNQMPVLTYDITFGTKKLIELNLSHNQINEIRRGVLSNFTSLVDLDLSHNNLRNLESEEHIFDLPKNLKILKLQQNKLYKLPFMKLSKHPRLEIINLQENQFIKFPEILVDLLRNGTNVIFDGNPLHCNCEVRPLKEYLLEFPVKRPEFQHLQCSSPNYVRDLDLYSVRDDQLQCTTEEKLLIQKEYNELTDLRIRDVSLKNDIITISWFAERTTDVADFTIFVRGVENEILHQEEYAYNIRRAQISRSKILKDGQIYENAEVCIVSRNSNGRAGKWFPGQCKKLSSLTVQSKGFFNNLKSSTSRKCVSLKHMLIIMNIGYAIISSIYVAI